MPVGGATIEFVRGALDERRSEQILGFWARMGELDDEAARERLDQVACVALDEAGEIVGVNSVREQDVGLVGLRFWAYRSLLSAGDDKVSSAMFKTAFEGLEERFDPDGSGPVGLCMTVADRAELERRPEVFWPEEELMFAGYLADGRQLRIRYFWRAEAEPGLPNSPTQDVALRTDYSIGDRYRVEPYTGDAAVADAILAMWARERVVPEPEAKRRVHEALNVVIDRDEGVVAVSTAYLQRNPQLRLDLWYFRTFVASAHRHTHVATQLTFHNRDLLEQRYTSGEDTRAAGVIFELENEGMRKYFNKAIWEPADFTFIGNNERGVPVRVHYFPGARAPLPQRAAG